MSKRLGSGMKLEELPEVLTIEQIASYCGVGRSTCYDAARRGELPTVRLGSRLIVPKARFIDFLNGGATDASYQNGGGPKAA
jgi:excisionase family DNA binding protein